MNISPHTPTFNSPDPFPSSPRASRLLKPATLSRSWPAPLTPKGFERRDSLLCKQRSSGERVKFPRCTRAHSSYARTGVEKKSAVALPEAPSRAPSCGLTLAAGSHYAGGEDHEQSASSCCAPAHAPLRCHRGLGGCTDRPAIWSGGGWLGEARFGTARRAAFYPRLCR